MKITKEEVIKLADTINISFNDEELVAVQSKLDNLTVKLDAILSVKVDEDIVPLASTTNNINQFSSNNNEEDLQFLKGANNYDGEYFKINKVIKDEQ